MVQEVSEVWEVQEVWEVWEVQEVSEVWEGSRVREENRKVPFRSCLGIPRRSVARQNSKSRATVIIEKT
jgi:hypothetical protein